MTIEDEATGKVGLLDVAPLKVSVRIISVKRQYGRLRYEVEPVAGTGICVVNADRVEISRDMNHAVDKSVPN